MYVHITYGKSTDDTVHTVCILAATLCKPCFYICKGPGILYNCNMCSNYLIMLALIIHTVSLWWDQLAFSREGCPVIFVTDTSLAVLQWYWCYYAFIALFYILRIPPWRLDDACDPCIQEPCTVPASWTVLYIKVTAHSVSVKNSAVNYSVELTSNTTHTHCRHFYPFSPSLACWCCVAGSSSNIGTMLIACTRRGEPGNKSVYTFIMCT